MILWDLCSLRFFCCSSLKIKSYWSSLLPWTLILIFVQAFSPRLSCLLHLYLQNPFCFALRNSVFWPMNSTFQRPHWLFSCFPYYNLSLYLMCFLLSLGEVGTASIPSPCRCGSWGCWHLPSFPVILLHSFMSYKSPDPLRLRSPNSNTFSPHRSCLLPNFQALLEILSSESLFPSTMLAIILSDFKNLCRRQGLSGIENREIGLATRRLSWYCPSGVIWGESMFHFS